MSDNWITVVPIDPFFVPDERSCNIALLRYIRMLPEAEKVQAVKYDYVHFFDCGTNCEQILCPNCESTINEDWWQEHMELDRLDDRGFQLDSYVLPCCLRRFTLNELIYVWPQRFGKFALDAMNPRVDKLLDSQRLELETALGTKLCVIYQHI